MTPHEEAAWYEAGLSADGCNVDEYMNEAILKYGRLLVETAAGKGISSEMMLLEAERQIDQLKVTLEHERKIHLKIAMKAESLHSRLHAALAKTEWVDTTPEDLTGLKEVE